MSIEALDRAVDIFKTQNALAAELKLRSASISGWRKRNRIPVERCRDIERVTGGRVTRYDLRPDMFGVAPPTQQPG
ncbi:MAG: YdaS family helix-turn-helix protein [Rhodanobacter sp.]